MRITTKTASLGDEEVDEDRISALIHYIHKIHMHACTHINIINTCI